MFYKQKKPIRGKEVFHSLQGQFFGFQFLIVRLKAVTVPKFCTLGETSFCIFGPTYNKVC